MKQYWKLRRATTSVKVKQLAKNDFEEAVKWLHPADRTDFQFFFREFCMLRECGNYFDMHENPSFVDRFGNW